MTSTEAAADEVTVTQRLLAAARSRGEHRALVGGPADPAGGYADLPATVQAAAAGAALRGLPPRDSFRVYFAGTASHSPAPHTEPPPVGVPSPGPPRRS